MAKMAAVKKYFTAMSTTVGNLGYAKVTRGIEYEVLTEDKYAQTVKFADDNGEEATMNQSGMMPVRGKFVYFKPVV